MNFEIPSLAYCETYFKYNRFSTSEVAVGNLIIGGSHPVRLQSMTTTNTLDTEKTVNQTIRIIEEGGELVRITTQGRREALNLESIRKLLHQKGFFQPLVADIHFNPNAADIAARLIEKVRINPGNFADGAKKFRLTNTDEDSWNEGIAVIQEKLIPFLSISRQHQTAIRIGTNHGSLSDRIMSKYGDTPQGMVESCMEYLRICRNEDFHQIVLSIKASNTRIMVHTVRLLVATMKKEGMNYPLHLGVTEAGNGEDGRIKSAVGIGALLVDGIGDTIRVSLTEDPENEIPVAKKLVEMVQRMENHSPIEPFPVKEFSPYEYNRRVTRPVLNIGGTYPPVVVHHYHHMDSALQNPLVPDYVYCQSVAEVQKAHDIKKPVICPAFIVEQLNDSIKNEVYALYQVDNYLTAPPRKAHFLEAEYSQLPFLIQLPLHPETILLVKTSNINYPLEIRAFVLKLLTEHVNNPVILFHTCQLSDQEDFQIKTSIDTGMLFLDGLADGLFLRNPHLNDHQILSTQYGILQATRVRFSKTEYISCPGCGRTLFDLQKVTQTIQQKTSHLKNLKIGIMGCIVNGIGEMADADYGYVGSGNDRVSLFKQKELIKKNIPAHQALDELIMLIKEHGDWVDP